MMLCRTTNRFGFTLIETVLVIAALSIILGIIIIALNPTDHVVKLNDAKRKIDVATIYSAIQRYRLDNHGAVPAGLGSFDLGTCVDMKLDNSLGICRTGATDCAGITLTELTTNQKYLAEIPVDPTGYSDTLSGYNIILDQNRNERVMICAPSAEGGEQIYIPR